MKRLSLLISANALLAIYSCGSHYAGTASLTSGSGNGIYIELVSNTSGKDISMQNMIKMYLAGNGKVRSEMNITGNGKTSSMVLLGDASNPYQSTSIDDSAKTFSINHIDTADLKNPMDGKSTATKIGEEKIAGFNCVHVQVIVNKGMGDFYKSVDTTDVWKSAEVPLPAAFKHWMDAFDKQSGGAMFGTDVNNQLKQMGCEGFLVKMQVRSTGANMTMQLTKVSHESFPAGMFEVPADYKQTKGF